MQHQIRKYAVQHPILRKYIKFFWEVRIEHAQIAHNLIPQRNINLRFNLSETPQYLIVNNQEIFLEDVFFSGLQNQFTSASLNVKGKIHTLGVCFQPEGFYPFLQIPVSTCTNQVLGAGEAGLKRIKSITAQLKEAPDTDARLAILEYILIALLKSKIQTPEYFQKLFHALGQNRSALQLSTFCLQHQIGMRQLERMYNKYVGVSARTFFALNRFHYSINQLLSGEYSKLSDIAYGNGYFDQMHFIRDFKRFAGNAPKSFASQNCSILQIGKFG